MRSPRCLSGLRCDWFLKIVLNKKMSAMIAKSGWFMASLIFCAFSRRVPSKAIVQLSSSVF